jgi:hypothetical protein
VHKLTITKMRHVVMVKFVSHYVAIF